MKTIRSVFLSVGLLMLFACTAVQHGHNLDAQLLELRKGKTLDQQQIFQFKIKLINAGERKMLFDAAVFNIELEGFRFLRQHKQESFVLEPNHSETIIFEYSLRLEDSVRLFNALAVKKIDQPSFRLRSTFKPKEWWQRSIYLEQSGNISLID